ncbi:TetR/AcrR family transcriptional regulator C-terminal domain-containing protein [Candidatus Saccharibacteria bacterium]|nr:TetR/AcrR family transcriptional regulator C-terminal domain-containing protein [Candidatus Saccharibacteria bacterium]
MKQAKYLSSIRTHEKIKRAFAILLAEKNTLSRITVAELSQKAQITRGTFYAHFNNIYEVAEEMENEFISALEESSRGMESVDGFPVYFHHLFEFLAEHEDLYRLLLSSDVPVEFILKFRLQMEKNIKRIMEKHQINRKTLDLDIAFFTDGATFMILDYFRGELTLSLSEIELYLKQRVDDLFFG